MSVTYSQLDREARKAAKLAQCAAQRGACLAALTEKRRAPPSELVEAMKVVHACLWYTTTIPKSSSGAYKVQSQGAGGTILYHYVDGTPIETTHINRRVPANSWSILDGCGTITNNQQQLVWETKIH